MLTFDDLPTEIRCIIYKHLFAGRTLRYNPPRRHTTRSATRKARARTQLSTTSILYMSWKSLREARPVLLKTAVIQLARLANNVTLTHECVIDTEFSNTISHVRLIGPSRRAFHVRDAIPAMVRVTDVMPNLKIVELNLAWTSSIYWKAGWLRSRIKESNFERMAWTQSIEFVDALMNDSAGGRTTYQSDN